MKKNSVRLIGGVWRSRIIHFADIPSLRPTPNRVRETVFNWLQWDLPGSRCLDLYAGSGAMSFEAVSRGAKEVIAVERDPEACRLIHANKRMLGDDKITLIESDVRSYLASAASLFDIVFLDPPFGEGLITEVYRSLDNTDWLTETSKIYTESERNGLITDSVSVGWQLIKQKTAGEVAYSLYQVKNTLIESG